MKGFESFYQSKIEGKGKGSGLGLYIDEKYTCEGLPDLCICTTSIETLFVKITNTREEIVVGVVYRPHRFMFHFSRINILLLKSFYYCSTMAPVLK